MNLLYKYNKGSGFYNKARMNMGKNEILMNHLSELTAASVLRQRKAVVAVAVYST